FATFNADLSFEYAADDTFLPPDLARLELAIRVKASKLGACAGAARRAVISFSGTEHKILTVDSSDLGRTEEFDVIDFPAVGTSNAIFLKRLPDRPSELSQLFDIAWLQFERVFVHQEK